MFTEHVNIYIHVWSQYAVIKSPVVLFSDGQKPHRKSGIGSRYAAIHVSSSYHFSSVAHSCSTLWSSRDCFYRSSFIRKWFPQICHLNIDTMVLWWGYQFSSVAQSCLTLCNPTDCSTPGLNSHAIHSQNLLKLMSIPVVPFNHFILCRPLLVLPSIFPSIRVFSKELVLLIKWSKYWSFSFSISPSIFQDWFPLEWTGWISLQSKGLSRVFESSPTPQFKSINSVLSFLYAPTLTSIHDYWKNLKKKKKKKKLKSKQGVNAKSDPSI